MTAPDTVALLLSSILQSLAHCNRRCSLAIMLQMPRCCAFTWGLLQDPRAKLSRDLVALLADDYVPAQQLLKRIFPSGLLMYLAQRQPIKVPRRQSVRQPEQARLALHHQTDTLASTTQAHCKAALFLHRSYPPR